MGKSTIRYLFPPFPYGWYSIGSAADIMARQITTLSCFGRELIAFCDCEKISIGA